MKKSNRFISVYVMTFLVAACSIIYELLFSQLLTVILGSTVVQYSLTIGTFLFFLGVGSLFYKKLIKNIITGLIKVEIAITIVGLLGVFSIPYLYTLFLQTSFLSSYLWVLVVYGYLCVAAIGFLSGLEIPILVDMAQKYQSKKQKRFSEILGVDYFGSLLGTVIYALVLYPWFGIFGTIIFVAATNFIVGIFLWFWFISRKKRKKSGLLFVVFTFILFIYLIVNAYAIEESVTREFRAGVIFGPYAPTPTVDPGITYTVEDFFATPYQDVLEVTVHLDPEKYDFYPLHNYRCIYIDSSVQFCENEVESYHGGLIDAPMRFFPENKSLSVLVIGGGDYIAIHNLLQFPNVQSIDHVDIDGEFVEKMKVNEFARRYHKDSYLSPIVTTYIEDGFTYALTTEKKYDFIVLDLPNVASDKVLSLFSVEFVSALEQTLSEDGIVVTWVYDDVVYPEEYGSYVKVLRQNFYEAGFTHMHTHYAYSLLYGTNKEEKYNLFSKKVHVPYNSTVQFSSYLQIVQANYTADYSGWNSVTDQGVRANSIYHPNTDIIVKVQ